MRKNIQNSFCVVCLCIRVCQDLFLLSLNLVIRMLGINKIIITLSHTEEYLHTDDLVHDHETECI